MFKSIFNEMIIIIYYIITSINTLFSVHYVFCVQHFDLLNKEFQSDAALVHKVKRRMSSFYHKLLLCFVKPSALNR